MLRAKSLGRKKWVAVFAASLLFSLAFALVSVWSVWSPYVTNWTVHGGDYEGVFPLSRLSYPVYMTVYHTPFKQQVANDSHMTGNVSFSVLLGNIKLIQANGVFDYTAIFGVTPFRYMIDFSALSDKMSFFGFLLILFTLFNIVGAIIGDLLGYAFARTR